MLPLDRPLYTARATFHACIGRVRNRDLHARLVAATPSIVDASDAFDEAAERHALHEIMREAIVAPDVTTEEMEKVYSQRMAKEGVPGRGVYDDIFTASPQGLCPLCVHRQVTTLDHHLPKAHYPALAVAPLNLVPSCSDCNRSKLHGFPHAAEEVALHPYYDDLGQDQWLHATVVETRPAAVRFRVVRTIAWDDLLAARVRNHFRLLGLGILYGAQAADELVNVRQQLTNIHAICGHEEVRRELDRRAISSAVGRPNGWRSATYRAWADSQWFCEGGFALED
jgi:hypothetical protein